ncbi:LysM peptidoglycan-binding domain-containing protein [Cysteiniphilum halobium]|uniref:LysM peptidoglycan-binding domain-containing protein n=1 Tax=Cysteiniphilum halobium TaxID=2219059 RepID=UPI003F8282F3
MKLSKCLSGIALTTVIGLQLSGCANTDHTYQHEPVVAPESMQAGAPTNMSTVTPKEKAKAGKVLAETRLSAIGFEGKTYTVKKGDTLYGIAIAHGKGKHKYAFAKCISQVNNLDSIHRLSIGEKLDLSNC